MATLIDTVLLLLTIGLKLATINLSAWVELFLRPVLRLLRRTFPPSRWLYALMRLGNGGRWRQETRAEIFEELYRMVVRAAKGAEEERPAESYDSTVVYLPALKVQVKNPEDAQKEEEEEEGQQQPPDDNRSTYFEAWAVLQEGHLQRSYISEALAQRMRLRQYPAPWDPQGGTVCVDVCLLPITDDVGLPLEAAVAAAAAESPHARLHGDLCAHSGAPLQLVVLPMEQFGRLDIRLASQGAEEVGEALGRPLKKPHRITEEEEEERSEGGVTAQLILGQAAYCDHFMWYCCSSVRGGGSGDEGKGLAFLNFGPYGNIVVGGTDGGEYQAYSSAKVIWLWVFALIIVPLYLLHVYLQLYVIGLLLHWKPMLLLLNRVIVPAALGAFFLLAMVRFSLKGEYGAGRLLRRLPGSENEVDSGGSIGSHHWSRFARWAATRLDDALLRAFNWLLDGRHSVQELAGKEFAEFRQYWSRWLRWKLINGLVPSIRAPPTPSNNGAEGTARSVHFADQHEYLPEESRAEMGREGRRYRMVLRARVLNDNHKSPNDQNKEEEIRILLNPCIDHSVITERAVARLGLRRHAIWPRFQWGLYPRDDDMAVCTEVVTLTVAPSREITPAVPPALPVRLELQVQARDFTGDRPLPLSLRKQLQREFSVQLSDGAPEGVPAAAAEDHPHHPRQLEHHVDVVVGADQLYSAFFSDREPVKRCPSASIPVKDLVGIEIGLLRQTSTGFGAVFAGFEQPLDAKGRRAVERKRAALEELHQKMSFMDEML